MFNVQSNTSGRVVHISETFLGEFSAKRKRQIIKKNSTPVKTRSSGKLCLSTRSFESIIFRKIYLPLLSLRQQTEGQNLGKNVCCLVAKC